MNAMLLEAPRKPLKLRQVPIPQPAADQLLIRVIACGICRTDLHVIDGELSEPKLPLIPGHEIIGRVAAKGSAITGFEVEDLIGVPWLGYTCGACKYCIKGRENLCERARFTGYTIDGGYAEYTIAYAQFCFKLPEQFAGPHAAPLMCAGLIGYRSYKMAAASARNIGIYGFGAAAHIMAQIAKAQGKQVFAFTRVGDAESQAFALRMGAAWAGSSSDDPPEKLDVAIILAPAGELVPKALKNLDKGGQVICGGIHMSDIPSFPYHILWEERSVQSVANLTRNDGLAFLELLKMIPVQTQVETYPLDQANVALNKLREGKIKGAAVLVIE